MTQTHVIDTNIFIATARWNSLRAIFAHIESAITLTQNEIKMNRRREQKKKKNTVNYLACVMRLCARNLFSAGGSFSSFSAI